MADFPPPRIQATDVSPQDLPVTAGILAYVLFAVAVVTGLASSGIIAFAPLWGLAGFAGLIVAYVKRGDARGTWLESHFSWLIRTFWWSLVWDLIGAVLFITLIGIPIAIAIWAVVSLWGLYRVIRGYLAFKDNRPIS
jgi:uncharacterized membrane protein